MNDKEFENVDNLVDNLKLNLNKAGLEERMREHPLVDIYCLQRDSEKVKKLADCLNKGVDIEMFKVNFVEDVVDAGSNPKDEMRKVVENPGLRIFVSPDFKSGGKDTNDEEDIMDFCSVAFRASKTPGTMDSKVIFLGFNSKTKLDSTSDNVLAHLTCFLDTKKGVSGIVEQFTKFLIP